MGVSKNNGTPKSSILIRCSIINHPFWWVSPYFWKHPNRNMSTPTYWSNIKSLNHWVTQHQCRDQLVHHFLPPVDQREPLRHIRKQSRSWNLHNLQTKLLTCASDFWYLASCIPSSRDSKNSIPACMCFAKKVHSLGWKIPPWPPSEEE